MKNPSVMGAVQRAFWGSMPALVAKTDTTDIWQLRQYAAVAGVNAVASCRHIVNVCSAGAKFNSLFPAPVQYLSAKSPAVMRSLITEQKTTQLPRDKLLVEHWNGSLLMTNTRGSSCKVTHYRVKAIRPQLSIAEAMATGYTDLLTPNSPWNQAPVDGVVPAVFAAGAAPNDKIATQTQVPALCAGLRVAFDMPVTQTLFDNPEFGKNFKVVGSKTKILSTGQSWHIGIKYKKPFVFNNESTYYRDTSGNSASYEVAKGNTFSVFRLEGSLLTDATLPNQQTLGQGNVDIMVQYKMDYKVFPLATQTINRQMGIATGLMGIQAGEAVKEITNVSGFVYTTVGVAGTVDGDPVMPDKSGLGGNF